jgi:hypothetical protein
VAGVNGILFSQAPAAEGAVVFAKACELGLEGIVYKGGPSRNWLRTINPDFVRTLLMPRGGAVTLVHVRGPALAIAGETLRRAEQDYS